LINSAGQQETATGGQENQIEGNARGVSGVHLQTAIASWKRLARSCPTPAVSRGRGLLTRRIGTC
jgi:hypothetical protein